ncbi:9321_t:CDS:2, partial [Scutellospora calospora]
MDPQNTSLYNKNICVWAKKHFRLEEIVPGDYRVIVKATNNPVLITENMYEILCQVHSQITQHEGHKQTWKTIRERHANGILEQKLGKWKEETGHSDWSFSLRFVITAMNTSWYRSHKKTSYELVYSDKPCSNCTLVNDLFERNILNEEEIPDSIDIQSISVINFDNDISESLFQELNDASGINLPNEIYNHLLEKISSMESSQQDNSDIKQFAQYFNDQVERMTKILYQDQREGNELKLKAEHFIELIE